MKRILVVALFPLLAQAEVTPAPTLTTTVTLASQYVSRGIRQTWGHPAMQVGVDYVHPSGWSAGTWASTVSDKFVENSSIEWDLYGGYSATAGEIGYSVLLYQYIYPGARISATNTSFNYSELALGLTWRAAYIKYNYTLSKDFFGIINGRGTGYLDVGVNYDIGQGYTLNLHAGDGRVAGTGNDIWNWRDVKVGVTKALDGGWAVAGAVTRGKGATNVYREYTSGVTNAAGQLDYSNAEKTTWAITVAKSF